MTHTTLTITAKGQVTLQPALLEHLGAEPGGKLLVSLLPGGRVELHTPRPGSIDAFIGSPPRDGEAPLSIEDMNRAIEDGWAGLPLPPTD